VNDLDEKSVDKRVNFYKAIAGISPIGGFISEFLIDKIPDQRLERLFQFVEELNERVSKLENANFLDKSEYHMLVEKAVIDASQPISAQRSKWLASLTTPHASTSDSEIEFRHKCINILSTLSDPEVEYLISFQDFQSKGQFERKRRGHFFVSDARTDENQNELSDQQIFERQLANEQVKIDAKSLKSAGLIEAQVLNDELTDNYHLARLGNLFLYAITDQASESPDHNAKPSKHVVS